jgi:hypothetical protein
MEHMLHGRRYWVEKGVIGPNEPDPHAMSTAMERRKFELGHVRLTTGDLGTEIKWSVFSPCLSSLFVVCDWIQTAAAPFVLRFNSAGWFEEFHGSAEKVIARLDEIIARGDRHFTTRTLIKEFEMQQSNLTPLLKECYQRQSTAEEYAVECVYEEVDQQFNVHKIGPKSAINRVYGTFLSSFPCQASNSYSRTVSQAYAEVINTGQPRYDHVLAAMRMPDNDILWVPYRRLVLPKLAETTKPTVLVVSEITKVDIQLI